MRGGRSAGSSLRGEFSGSSLSASVVDTALDADENRFAYAVSKALARANSQAFELGQLTEVLGKSGESSWSRRARSQVLSR